MRALGWGGRFLVVGFASGGANPKAAIPQVPKHTHQAIRFDHVCVCVCMCVCRADPSEPGAAERARGHRLLLGHVEKPQPAGDPAEECSRGCDS